MDSDSDPHLPDDDLFPNEALDYAPNLDYEASPQNDAVEIDEDSDSTASEAIPHYLRSPFFPAAGDSISSIESISPSRGPSPHVDPIQPFSLVGFPENPLETSVDLEDPLPRFPPLSQGSSLITSPPPLQLAQQDPGPDVAEPVFIRRPVNPVESVEISEVPLQGSSPPPATSRREADDSSDDSLPHEPRKKLRLNPSLNGESSSSAAAEKKTTVVSPEEDKEADSCIICFDAITAEGDHRACCLKCGHIFGFECISKWLGREKDKDRKTCPQCKMSAKSSDIRPLFISNTLKVLDNFELFCVKKDLCTMRMQLRTAEDEATFSKVRLTAAQEENKRLRTEKTDLERLVQEFRRQSGASSTVPVSNPPPMTSSVPTNTTAATVASGPKTRFVLHHVMDFGRNTARVMAFYPYQNMLVISQKLDEADVGPFGKFSALKLVNGVDFVSSEIMRIPCGLIKDVSVNNHGGTALVASVNNMITVVSLTNRSIVHQYREESPIWSCAFNTEDHRYLYAGLQNGSVSVFDLRNLSCRVATLNHPTNPFHTPIFRMHHIDRQPGHQFPLGGLLVTTMDRCGLYCTQDSSMVNYEYHNLVQSGLRSTGYDRKTRMVGNSFRPDGGWKNVRHQVCEMCYTPREEVMVSVREIAQVTAGTLSLQMSRSAFVQDRTDEVFFAASDESRKAVMLWDMTDKQPKQVISVSNTALDICPLNTTSQRMFALLMEKGMQIYSAV